MWQYLTFVLSFSLLTYIFIKVWLKVFVEVPILGSSSYLLYLKSQIFFLFREGSLDKCSISAAETGSENICMYNLPPNNIKGPGITICFSFKVTKKSYNTQLKMHKKNDRQKEMLYWLLKIVYQELFLENW